MFGHPIIHKFGPATSSTNWQLIKIMRTKQNYTSTEPMHPDITQRCDDQVESCRRCMLVSCNPWTLFVPFLADKDVFTLTPAGPWNHRKTAVQTLTTSRSIFKWKWFLSCFYIRNSKQSFNQNLLHCSTHIKHHGTSQGTLQWTIDNHSSNLNFRQFNLTS